MIQYRQLVTNILENGYWKENRTGVDRLSILGHMMKFDLTKGFPAMTTKQFYFKSAAAEILGLLRGYTNAGDFRKLGTKVWDANANLNQQWLNNPNRIGEDDLGGIYGAQWRSWPSYKLLKVYGDEDKVKAALDNGYQVMGTMINKTTGEEEFVLYKAIDQLMYCLNEIMTDPGSARILFHAWNCSQLDSMALPPCHLLYQFGVNVTDKEISMCVYIRSNDVGKGTPFNIAEAALMLSIVGRLTGYTPKWLTYMIGDAHIYRFHKKALGDQILRDPYRLPKLIISDNIPDYSKTGEFDTSCLNTISPDDFSLEGYRHHPAIDLPMAV